MSDIDHIRATGHAKGALEVLSQQGTHLGLQATDELLDMVAVALAPRIAALLAAQASEGPGEDSP